MSEAEATLIEGIGDEVLLFGSFAVTLIVAVFAAFYIQPSLQRRRNSQTQRARRDVSPAVNGSSRAAGDTAGEDSVQAPQTQLHDDSHTDEPAADRASSAADDEEPPSQQDCAQNDTDVSQEEVDPDVVRQRRLEFMQRNVRVEVLDTEEQREPEREGSSPDTDGAAAVHPLDDEEEEGGFAIRLKYLNDTERCVRGRPDETVASFKRRHFAAELAGQRLVRLIYNGGQLRDDSASLSACGLSDGCVVHVHVSTAPVVQNDAASASSSNGEGDLNLGALMWPLFAAMLGILWVLHFQYRELFNTSTTMVLVGISGLFCVGLYGQQYPQSPMQAANQAAPGMRTAPSPSGR